MNSALLQPFRFLLVGSINTLVGLSIIFAAKGIAGLDDFVSNLLGYSLGLLISFFLTENGHFVITAV